ncbi:Sorting nexin-17 [Geodia barretti]|uniref:Sorting nexin-17 n=1 Tax=Geodia barretti TaxID=519541 RepID=A0AA35RAD5_GEOBA|nr:Sorting nexin-17 [Geodia barretti]
MLVQIPSISDAVDDRGRLYKVFNIYIGGHYHCSLRYSHLLHFSQELGRNFDTSGLDEFPTKRVFSLTAAQLDERRAGLERYLHSVCQDRVIQQSDMLKEFLVAAQKASSGVTDEDVSMEIFLINGNSVTISGQSFSRSDEVLERAVVKIGADPSLTYYFSLFLEEETGDGWTLYRHLQDHEAPFVSLKTVNSNGSFRITVRMSFWGPEMVSGVLADEAATNLLYIETIDHITKGEWEVGKEVKEKLAELGAKSLKKEYMETASTIPQFAYQQMEGLTFDHPSEDLHGFARIGRREIVTYTTEGEGEWGGAQGHGVRCRSYQLTRIRCWKVGYWESGEKWLAFHYHHGDTEEDFVWVRLVGKATIFLTLCIQSAVNELIRVSQYYHGLGGHFVCYVYSHTPNIY